MVSLNPTYCQTSYSLKPFSFLNYPIFPNLCFIHNPNKRPQKYRKIESLSHFSSGFVESRKGRRFGGNLDSSWCCRCERSEGDIELEKEIMEFMRKSEKPTMFPSREELVRGGRMDLVEAIRSRGGWYCLGWDEGNVGDGVEGEMDFDVKEFHERVERCGESVSLREVSGEDSFCRQDDEEGLNALEPVSVSSLGRSLEIGADEDSGIDGILSRLEKQRNSDFGINLGKHGFETNATRKDEGHLDTFVDVASIDLGENNRLLSDSHIKGISNSRNGNLSSNDEPETWRNWSNRRAGFDRTDFEAAEISFSKNERESDKEVFYDGIIVATDAYAEASEEYAGAWDRHKKINHNQIRIRLQHLEAELSTALHSLRSKREEHATEEVNGSPSDLHKLSDAWEFQENEFMSAQEKLRSIRAKLAVLEGKMALSIINAQKMVEEKQKRITGARKALQLLRTTCIVWPNSASEVLLAGSFDGWTTQRKMEKSKTGIFSLSLKLYPGRYEIKFIVDGEWKVDPLRPIVNHNGYTNNLLLVT